MGTAVTADAHNAKPIDPTKNVLDLVDAANKRQDDLRELNNTRLDSDLKHVEDIAKLRADHQKQMDAAESSRLDSIRQIDVLAVNTAAERALAALKTLETTTASNAENLRTALTNTATTIATQLTNTVAGINERLAALERSSYEGKGKQLIADPQLADMISELKNLREQRATTTGKSEGVSASWGFVVGIVGLIATLITVGTFAFSDRTPPAPIYTPAPYGTVLPSSPPQAVPR